VIPFRRRPADAPLNGSRPAAGWTVPALAALAAAALSALYIAIYLRGGPRIIDATSYWLEARAMARGHFAWPLDEPAASTMGRFLTRADGPAGETAAVIFPPGYPALLALGFLVGAPLAVGPLLAAALVIATVDLARRVGGSRAGEPAAIIAAGLSVACAALRYHTADTMSHGLAALCFTGALTLTLRAVDHSTSRRGALGSAALAGLLAGWLVATRPVSALALGITLGLALLLGARLLGAAPAASRVALAVTMALCAAPGALLLLAHQRAATGALGVSSQALYYSVSDGPPGCFRYGFGAGVGCLGEHGDFVRAQLAHGYGALEAAGTTLRRLKQHLVDPANLEILALLVPAGAALAWREPRARLLALGIAAQILVYVPFYFDGNYPGGGARLYADVLPLEHTLIALGALAIAARLRRPRWAGVIVAAALLGFVVRARTDHAQLRDREGGRPMFEPAVVAAAGASDALLFFDTDHGFNLAFDPGASPGAARLRGDALDAMVWEARGRPRALHYRFDVPDGGGTAVVSLVTIDPSEWMPPETIEGESLWPAAVQRRAWALPEHAGGTCASAGRWLRVHREPGDAPAEIGVRLPAPWVRGGSVAPRLAVAGDVAGEIRLEVDGARVAAWSFEAPTDGDSDPEPAQADPIRCVTLPPRAVPASARSVGLVLVSTKRGEHGIVALDRVDLRGASGPGGENR
jgi:hypothetical protein